MFRRPVSPAPTEITVQENIGKKPVVLAPKDGFEPPTDLSWIQTVNSNSNKSYLIIKVLTFTGPDYLSRAMYL